MATLVEITRKGFPPAAQGDTEELCGHSSSASAISAVVKQPDGELQAAERELCEAYTDLIVDAPAMSMGREAAGLITSQAVLFAVCGVFWTLWSSRSYAPSGVARIKFEKGQPYIGRVFAIGDCPHAAQLSEIKATHVA